MKHFGIISVNIASQNLELIERLTLPQNERLQRLNSLKIMADLSGLVYLATCNRVEFIFVSNKSNDIVSIRNRILDLFFEGQQPTKFEPNDFSLHTGLDAIRHLFTVASALDSMMVGEAQILGQVKNALTYSQQNGLIDSRLDRIFQAAFRVAKKVRSETDLGKGNVSVVGLVTALMRDFIKSEGQVPVVLFGVGEMTRKVAAYLKDQGITDLLFVNRTESNISPLLEQFGGKGVSLKSFLENPSPARILCTATSSPTPIITDKEMKALLDRVDQKRILAIDLAVPRDIEISEEYSTKVELFNMSDIKQLSDTNRRQRFRDVDLAREIIDDEVDRFHHDEVEESLKGFFAESHRDALELAQKCLDDLFSKHLSNLDDKDRKKIEYMMNKVVNYTAYRPAHNMAKKIAAPSGSTPANLPESLRNLISSPKGN